MKAPAELINEAMRATLGIEFRWAKRRQHRKDERIHFLHLGKNAGTQIRYYLRAISQSRHDIQFEGHNHRIRLMDLPKDAQYFFSVRNPISRFKSGFYSRKRKGQPKFYVEWSDCERRAFSEFEHANDLAEALYCDGEPGLRAFCAMKSISHIAMNQVDWFARFGNMFDERPPFAIIRQEEFDNDIQRFQIKLGINQVIASNDDPVASHKNDYRNIPAFSVKAIKNLQAWYIQDFEFYRCCEKWINANM